MKFMTHILSSFSCSLINQEHRKCSLLISYFWCSFSILKLWLPKYITMSQKSIRAQKWNCSFCVTFTVEMEMTVSVFSYFYSFLSWREIKHFIWDFTGIFLIVYLYKLAEEHIQAYLTFLDLKIHFTASVISCDDHLNI